MMKKTGILTDSHSGITQEEAKKTWDICVANAILH